MPIFSLHQSMLFMRFRTGRRGGGKRGELEESRGNHTRLKLGIDYKFSEALYGNKKAICIITYGDCVFEVRCITALRVGSEVAFFN